MKVELLSCTPDALDLLLRTKNTRLAGGSDPATWTEEKKAEHLAYMRDTIHSSWEFVDYTFRIEGVTRAFTHQLVRTRSGSYAQESQRTVDVRGHDVIEPETVNVDNFDIWALAAEKSKDAYAELIDKGMPAQDARGILPTNISTSIIAKFNLRTLSDMARVRLCTRTQGEYQRVFREMRRLVLEQHPWAEDFIQPQCAADGTCAFPRYGKKECRYYDAAMDLSAVRDKTRKVFWAAAEVVEATPRAFEGKAQ